MGPRTESIIVWIGRRGARATPPFWSYGVTTLGRAPCCVPVSSPSALSGPLRFDHPFDALTEFHRRDGCAIFQRLAQRGHLNRGSSPRARQGRPGVLTVDGCTDHRMPWLTQPALSGNLLRHAAKVGVQDPPLAFGVDVVVGPRDELPSFPQMRAPHLARATRPRGPGLAPCISASPLPKAPL